MVGDYNMGNLEEICNTFFSGYDKLNKAFSLEKRNLDKLSSITFELNDTNEKIFYDYKANNIIMPKSLVSNQDAKFYVGKVLLHAMSRSEENGISYCGLSYSNNDKTINEGINNMIQNYICNVIMGYDIDDKNRLFINKIEKIIKPEEILNCYFNSDIVTFRSRFEEAGIDFDKLSLMFDLFNSDNYSNDMGTEIDKILINGVISLNKVPINYSEIEITPEMTKGITGFNNIEDNKKYYYSKINNINNNIKLRTL